MPDVGGFGQAITLMATIAGLGILTPFFVMYSSHIYMTALTLSSGGVNRIVWPRESVYDWFGQGVLVLGVLLVWSVLVLPLVAVVALIAPGESGFAVWFVLMVLLLPISLCSALLAPSPLLLIFPPFLIGVCRHIKALAFVYAVSTPLLVVAGAGLWLIVMKQNALGILIVAAILPPALLLHARAWGRLGWLVLNFESKPRNKKRSPPPEPQAEEAPLEVELEPADEEEDRYGVGDSVEASSARLATMTEHFDEQHADDRRRRKRAGERNVDPYVAPRAPTFQTALGQQVVTFLLHPETLGVWFSFGVYCLVEMTLVYVLISMLTD